MRQAYFVLDALIVYGRTIIKAIIINQELTTTGARLIRNQGHRVHVGWSYSSPSQNIYTYNYI